LEKELIAAGRDGMIQAHRQDGRATYRVDGVTIHVAHPLRVDGRCGEVRRNRV